MGAKRHRVVPDTSKFLVGEEGLPCSFDPDALLTLNFLFVHIMPIGGRLVHKRFV
jgi:hypothetical protein